MPILPVYYAEKTQLHYEKVVQTTTVDKSLFARSSHSSETAMISAARGAPKVEKLVKYFTECSILI